jgi:hypothetical protein
MITILLPLLGLLIVATLVRFQRGAGRRWTVHLLAISATVLVMALARAASSSGANECALDLAASPAGATAKVHR